MTRLATDELTVVCYDIADNRRRYRVVRILEGYGVRVQESVFECWLRPEQFRRLRTELSRVMNRDEDRIGFYRLTREDGRATILLGQERTISRNPGSYCV